MRAGAGGDGDTTGCGDNFLGGVLTSVAIQMLAGRCEGLELADACAWGVASGGYACFYPGGMFHETSPGTKRRAVTGYYSKHLDQLRSLPVGTGH